MIYHWYQADFEPVKGQQYNKARFRAASFDEALEWPDTQPKFKNRRLLLLVRVSPELELELNQALIQHLKTRDPQN